MCRTPHQPVKGADGGLDHVWTAGGQFIQEYVNATVPYMAFGEFWDTCEYTDGVLNYNQDGHRQRTVNWCDATGGTSAAFDFTTKGELGMGAKYCQRQIADAYTMMFATSVPAFARVSDRRSTSRITQCKLDLGTCSKHCDALPYSDVMPALSSPRVSCKQQGPPGFPPYCLS